MITKIQLPKKDKDSKGEKPHKSGSPRILASIPKKDGESRVDFAKRFIDKLAEK